LGLDAQCSKRLIAPADSFPACLHSEGRNHRKRMTKAIKTSAACYDCNPILAGGDDVVTRSHEPAGASPASGASMTSFNSQRQGNCGISWSGNTARPDSCFARACVRGCSLSGMVIGNQSGRIYERDHRRLIPIIPANFQLRFRPSMLEPVAIGRLELLQEPPFTLCGTRQQRSRASLRDLIFVCRAFGVIFLEPCTAPMHDRPQYHAPAQWH
jgi:hypothetical protein